ncbi:Alpha-ribazole-5'-phosphate phosphatase [Rhodovastum atsumiense]|uniref:Alpha-ribazole phosphatase family protein n=1 Tax=Rhodovastum atsumiense TaxID=504468 RepID=A0A5M6IT69_9PROT|nr:alpha-ribazole phosphatase family protein [Rhodovastum atsumiense]KAA5610635.1 alpha-ribazole phosphatase family protein [Rhodovastum atsumiense]CAH2600759.1 Alpha-ribazole-5'-phosphate phosphatase [Rhodovastum atsumiense]
MKLILVRHTAVAGVQGLCYGRTEVALADSFPADAEAVRAALPPGPWVLQASPAQRCRRLADRLGGPVGIDPRLHELDFGAWEGQSWDDLPRPELDRWCAGFVTLSPPGGESFTDLATRALAFAADMARRHPGACVVAVTHAGVIRALLAARRGIPYADAFSIAVPPGSVHRLEAAA